MSLKPSLRRGSKQVPPKPIRFKDIKPITDRTSWRQRTIYMIALEDLAKSQETALRGQDLIIEELKKRLGEAQGTSEAQFTNQQATFLRAFADSLLGAQKD